MKQSEAVQCGRRFKCPRGGCQVAQRWVSLCKHMTLFHRIQHYWIDRWRDTLTIEDGVDVYQVKHNKRTAGAERHKRQAPPPAKPKVAEVHVDLENHQPSKRPYLAGTFRLGIILKPRPA